MADLSILDQSVNALLADAASLPVEDLMVLLAAETAGKTRKSAVAGLEELIAEAGGESAKIPPCTCEIVATHEGGTVHLGDGRRLAHGEAAEVPVDVAEALRDAGLAE